MKNADRPAMPFVEPLSHQWASTGLTKREYFAAMAMQGLLSGPNLDDLRASEVAHDSLLYADALLAELEKDNG